MAAVATTIQALTGPGTFTEMQAGMFTERNHHVGWQPNCLVIASSEERESRCLKSPK
jgi:hypothetical protein